MPTIRQHGPRRSWNREGRRDTDHRRSGTGRDAIRPHCSTELIQLHVSPLPLGAVPSPTGRVHLPAIALPAANDCLIRQSAALLTELAARHAIRSIQLGTDAAELVVSLEEGRSYFDLAEFEGEAEVLLRHRVNVTSAGAPGAHPRELLSRAPAA